MAQVAPRGVVYLVDCLNFILLQGLEGLAPPDWRDAPPSREQREKHIEVATWWLARYCAGIAAAAEMYYLVQDAPREVWGYQEAVQTGFAFNETDDADAGIIMLVYRLMRKKLDELSRWAAYEPVDTPFFSKEEFGRYAPKKAIKAARLWELRGNDIKRLIDAAPRERVVVLVSKDKYLCAACRMAGAVVDGELVDDFYAEAPRAWREWNKVPQGTIHRFSERGVDYRGG